MNIIGIDPGKTGALCWIRHQELVEVVKMPDLPHGLVEQLDMWGASDDRYSAWYRAVVEHVSAGGVLNKEGRKMGATSAFTFGQGFGSILGTLAANRVSYELVRPAKWTAAMGERGKDKNSHWAHSKRLYPNVKIYKYAADAVLLAEYGRRFLWPTEAN